MDEWFRNYIQPSSKIKTCERYSEIIEKHLKVKLGEYELDEALKRLKIEQQFNRKVEINQKLRKLEKEMEILNVN